MFPEFRKWKTELTENGNFRLLAANGKRERQTSVLLKTETENGSFFSFFGKRSMVIDDCCFSKRAHVCTELMNWWHGWNGTVYSFFTFFL
jgi:hypothetical protein